MDAGRLVLVGRGGRVFALGAEMSAQFDAIEAVLKFAAMYAQPAEQGMIEAARAAVEELRDDQDRMEWLGSVRDGSESWWPPECQNFRAAIDAERKESGCG